MQAAAWSHAGACSFAQMSVCPGGVPTSYSYFIPQEAHLETRVVTRAYMESKLAVLMAGRVAERTLLGEDYISTAGANDLEVRSLTCPPHPLAPSFD